MITLILPPERVNTKRFGQSSSVRKTPFLDPYYLAARRLYQKSFTAEDVYPGDKICSLSTGGIEMTVISVNKSQQTVLARNNVSNKNVTLPVHEVFVISKLENIAKSLKTRLISKAPLQ